jgi:O-antigen/teichoic acid export membrane protein
VSAHPPEPDKSGTIASSIRGYLRASFTVGILSLTRLVTGFVTTKYLAVATGAVGVGIFAQANQLYLLAITIGSAMVAGVTRKISDARKSPQAAEEEAAVMGTAFTLQGAASMVCLVLAVVTAPFLSRLIFGDVGSALYVIPVALAIPFAVVGNGYIAGIIYGKLRYDLYTRAAILSAVVTMVAFVILTWRWQAAGAVWSLLVAAAALFAACAYYVAKMEPLGRVFGIRVHRGMAGELLSYAGVAVVAAAATAAALLIVRGYLVNRLGAGANGLYQVPIGFTAYYTPFLTNGLSARLLPAVSPKGDPLANRNELNAAVRLVIGGCMLCVVSILAVGDLAIRIVYTETFVPATRLLAIQLPGDVAYFLFMTVTMYLLAQGKLRAYLLGWLVYGVLLVATSITFVQQWGLEGAAWAYLVTCAVLGTAALVVYWRAVEPAEAWSTAGLLSLAVALAVVEALLLNAGAPLALRLALPVGVLAIAVLRLDKSTWRQFLSARRVPSA